MLLGASTMFAQGSKIVSIDDFSGLKVVGNIDVELIKSDQNKADVKVITGNIDALAFTVNEEGELRVGFVLAKKQEFSNNKAKVKLYYRELSSVKAIASAKIISKSAIVTNDLKVISSADSFVSLLLKVDNLDANVNAGSTIILSGDAHNMNAKATSGSHFKAGQLYSNNVNAKALSGADMVVYSSESISAKANSGGNISYKGSPSKEDINDSVSGRIRKM